MAALIAGLAAAGCASNDGEVIGKPHVEVIDGQYTPEIMHQMGKVSDPQISPDGTKILYGVSYTSIEQNKGVRNLFVMDIDGSNNHQISASPKSISNARWICDGGKILYLKDGKLHCCSAEGKDEVEIAVEGVPSIEAFELNSTNDGILMQISVKYGQRAKDLHPDLQKVEARVIDNLMYRHWDHFVEEVPHTLAASIKGITDGGTIAVENVKDLLEGTEYELPAMPFSGLEQLSWSNGSIAYSCRKLIGREYAFSTNADIYLYSTGDGSTKDLMTKLEGEFPGYDTEPAFSPDGKYLSWISMARGGYEADKRRLMLLDISSMKCMQGEACPHACCNGEGTCKEEHPKMLVKELSCDFKYNVDEYVWSADSKKIYFTSCVNAVEGVFELDVEKDCSVSYVPAPGEKTGDVVLGNGIRRITAEDCWYDFSSLKLVPGSEGKLIAVNASMMRPAEIVSIDIESGAVEQLSHENDNIIAQLVTPSMDQKWIKTVDGKDMHCWVLYPPEFDSTKVYPAITICLGGPQGTCSQGWSTRWNYRLMASNGYVVILPNRRGTTAFGQAWCEQISGDYIGLNMQDYMSAAKYLRAQPYIGKVAAAGASYGGYSIYNLAGVHNGLFDAFIAHAGIFNQEHMYMMTEEMWFPTWDNGGAPWDNNPVAVRHYTNSPHKLIKNWNTPIMIMHGEMDYRVPVDQGMAAFNAAQMMGVPSKMVLFPGENHWILKAQNSVLWYREFFNWFDRWCK